MKKEINWIDFDTLYIEGRPLYPEVEFSKERYYPSVEDMAEEFNLKETEVKNRIRLKHLEKERNLFKEKHAKLKRFNSREDIERYLSGIYDSAIYRMGAGIASAMVAYLESLKAKDIKKAESWITILRKNMEIIDTMESYLKGTYEQKQIKEKMPKEDLKLLLQKIRNNSIKELPEKEEENLK